MSVCGGVLAACFNATARTARLVLVWAGVDTPSIPGVAFFVLLICKLNKSIIGGLIHHKYAQTSHFLCISPCYDRRQTFEKNVNWKQTGGRPTAVPKAMHNRPEKPLILYFNGSGRVGGEKAWALHGTFVIDKSTRLEDFSNIDKNSEDRGYLTGLMLVQVLDTTAAKESKAVTNKSAPARKREGAAKGRGRGKARTSARGAKRPRALDDEFGLESAFPSTLPSGMIGASMGGAAAMFSNGQPVAISTGNSTMHLPLNSIMAGAGMQNLGHSFYSDRIESGGGQGSASSRSMGMAGGGMGMYGSTPMSLPSANPMGMSRGPSAIGSAANSSGDLCFANGFSIPSSTAAQFGGMLQGGAPPARSASMMSDSMSVPTSAAEYPMPAVGHVGHSSHGHSSSGGGLDTTVDGDDGMETGELPPMPTSTELKAVPAAAQPPAMSAPMPAAASGSDALSSGAYALSSPNKRRRDNMLAGTTPARDNQATPDIELPRTVASSQAAAGVSQLSLQMPSAIQNAGLGGGITPAGSVEGAAAALASMQGISMADLQPSTSPTSGAGQQSPPGRLAGARVTGGRLAGSTFASSQGIALTHLTGFSTSQAPLSSSQLPPHPSHSGSLLTQGGGHDDGDGLMSGDGSGELTLPVMPADDDASNKDSATNFDSFSS